MVWHLLVFKTFVINFVYFWYDFISTCKAAVQPWFLLVVVIVPSNRFVRTLVGSLLSWIHCLILVDEIPIRNFSFMSFLVLLCDKSELSVLMLPSSLCLSLADAGHSMDLYVSLVWIWSYSCFFLVSGFFLLSMLFSLYNLEESLWSGDWKIGQVKAKGHWDLSTCDQVTSAVCF